VIDAQPAVPYHGRVPPLLNVVGFALLGLGIALLVAAALQDFAGVSILGDPPWTVGGGVATIGGLLAGASRTKR
jgi:hypothetical protein